jgi:hypothetical protein
MAHCSPQTPAVHRSIGATSLLLVALLASPVTADQPELQLWGNVTLDWIQSHQLTLGVDIEPKVLVSKPSDDPGWATLDVTPSVEYTRGAWFDTVGELLVARTRQTDDLNSTEITPRVGFRFHILSNLENDFLKEKLARLVVAAPSKSRRDVVPDEPPASDRRRSDLRDWRCGVVLDRGGPGRAFRQQAARSCRHRSPAEPIVADEGPFHLGPVAEYGRRRIHDV